MTTATPTNIEGNSVIDCHLDCEFPVFLVEVTNQDWDECGKFAVVTDCGWNPLEGWRELDYRYFDTLGAACSAFDQEVRGLELTQPENTRFNALSFEGNLVLDSKQGQTGRILLVEVSNPEWDACGFFAVICDHGHNEIEGSNEWDISYFESLIGARSAFDERS